MAASRSARASAAALRSRYTDTTSHTDRSAVPKPATMGMTCELGDPPLCVLYLVALGLNEADALEVMLAVTDADAEALGDSVPEGEEVPVLVPVLVVVGVAVLECGVFEGEAPRAI